MNAQQLSYRLGRVASHVPEGAIVADIGSDHAYLPCYLVAEGLAERAIAGEVVKGPFESAKKQVRQEGLEDRITVRLASGLAAIEPADGVTAITIAGMGGPLIASILEQDKARLEGVQRLILQPNVHAKAIREWAAANGWYIVNEEILEENSKIYEIIVLEPAGKAVEFEEKELLFGPVLMAQRSDVFHTKWQREMAQWQKIVASMDANAEAADIGEKKQELAQKIKLVEEVLNGEIS
ncbi:tRNA (adenine(22)-N(1))-methyltransferase [Planococcus koreensis]|uniref:tRNA (adenine(22)-N(1))-methyltransferase n=1 Tax=Planococcus koreensis TaxID=112331 RepID=UPI0039FDDA82